MDSVGLDPEPLGSDPDINNGQCGSKPWVQTQTPIMDCVGLNPEPLGSDPDIKNGQCGSKPWVQTQTTTMDSVGPGPDINYGWCGPK